MAFRERRMQMIWQYRTIVFEFAKDGLLGDRYIDDEEMEATLNEQGKSGWELVDVVMVQEGVLAVLKRPRAGQTKTQSTVDAAQPLEQVSILPENSDRSVDECTVEELQEQEAAHIRQLEQQRKDAMEEHERDLIGEIQIR